MPLFLIILILIIIIFRFNILKKCNKVNIDTILNNGDLIEQALLKGDVFYKSKVKKDNNISYFVYIRLENGEEITVDNLDIYSSVVITDIIVFNKYLYKYREYNYSYYTICLDYLENIKLKEELNRTE